MPQHKATAAVLFEIFSILILLELITVAIIIYLQIKCFIYDVSVFLFKFCHCLLNYQAAAFHNDITELAVI